MSYSTKDNKGNQGMRNNEKCAHCGSIEFKDGKNNSYFCFSRCYLLYNFPPVLEDIVAP